jgi:hypothetical protein
LIGNARCAQGRRLAHGFDASQLAPGRYLVQVEAGDIRGNIARTSFPLALGPAV